MVLETFPRGFRVKHAARELRITHCTPPPSPAKFGRLHTGLRQWMVACAIFAILGGGRKLYKFPAKCAENNNEGCVRTNSAVRKNFSQYGSANTLAP